MVGRQTLLSLSAGHSLAGQRVAGQTSRALLCWACYWPLQQIHHHSQLTGARQAWALVMYRGRKEEEEEDWAARMRGSCCLLCAGAEAIEEASLGHEEGSCAVLGVIQR